LGIPRRAEGVRNLRKAHELDASVAGPVPDDIGELDTIYDSVTKLIIVLVVLAILRFGIKFLERLDACTVEVPVKPSPAAKKER